MQRILTFRKYVLSEIVLSQTLTGLHSRLHYLAKGLVSRLVHTCPISSSTRDGQKVIKHHFSYPWSRK